MDKDNLHIPHFFIDDFEIDMTRSQIRKGEKTVSMEPKVMQVLLILARNQGQVVSHATLLQNVWPNVVVTPGAIQRCIAQLRKVFNDDAKKQDIISTQPKVGYSLLPNIRWVSQQEKQTMLLKSSHFYWFVFSVVGILLALAVYFSNNKHREWQLKQITPLTATDQREFLPSFSPDGRYIAFQRYIQACERELWAKDLHENTEYLLTAHSGFYGQPQWSPDGKKIAFTSIQGCPKRKQCQEIQSVSFSLAKTKPQNPLPYISCQNEEYHSLSWLTDSELAFIAKNKNSSQVKLLDLTTNTIETIYNSANRQPYHLAYSPAQELLLIMQHDLQFDSEMVLFNPQNGMYQTRSLDLPENYGNYIWWRPNWHPSENAFILGNGKKLFEIDASGRVQTYKLPLLKNIKNPVYHPHGETIAATLGVLDSDVGLFDWSQSKQDQGIILRSIVQDFDAQFQPNGKNIAFLSDRSGSTQIWLRKGDVFMQLSNFPQSQNVQNFYWSEGGEYIVAIANHQLHMINLAGEMETLDTSFQAISLFQSLGNHSYLMAVTENDKRQIITFNMNTLVKQNVFNGFASWAQITEDQTLLFAAADKHIYRLSDGLSIPMPVLKQLKTVSKMHWQHQQLFVLSDEGELLSYSPVNNTHDVLFADLQHIQSIDDLQLDKRRFLYTTIISNKEEIVLLEH